MRRENVTRDGIEVRPPLHWDNPPPKKAPYSAPPEKRIDETPGATILPADAGL